MQVEKAETLRRLHHLPQPLLLPNIWNPIGARVLEHKGFPAVATASAAVSASLGFADGERLRLSTILDVFERIVGSVSLPVTADLEAGYGDSLEELAETVDAVLQTGVVGINIEDSVVEGESRRSLEDQCERLRVVRSRADSADVPLVINARVDTFLIPAKSDEQPGSSVSLWSDIESRARAYREAGADCIYPIGPGDAETVEKLRSTIDGPINILCSRSGGNLAALGKLGVDRVSFGPFVFRSALAHFADLADRVQAGDTSWLQDVPTGAEVAIYLRDEPEAERDADHEAKHEAVHEAKHETEHEAEHGAEGSEPDGGPRR